MRYIGYFIIGMWLTFQSLWSNNSAARFKYHHIRNDFAETVQLGEEFAKGIVCALFIIAIVIGLFYIWGII